MARTLLLYPALSVGRIVFPLEVTEIDWNQGRGEMIKNKLKSYSCAVFLINAVALNLLVPSAAHAASVAASNSSGSMTASTASATSSVSTASATSTSSSNPLTDEQINLHLFALEKQLFSEEYTSETVNQRLDRLDRFVLGSVQPGSVTKRLNRLVMDIRPRKVRRQSLLQKLQNRLLNNQLALDRQIRRQIQQLAKIRIIRIRHPLLNILHQMPAQRRTTVAAERIIQL